MRKTKAGGNYYAERNINFRCCECKITIRKPMALNLIRNDIDIARDFQLSASDLNEWAAFFTCCIV